MAGGRTDEPASATCQLVSRWRGASTDRQLAAGDTSFTRDDIATIAVEFAISASHSGRVHVEINRGRPICASESGTKGDLARHRTALCDNGDLGYSTPLATSLRSTVKPMPQRHLFLESACGIADLEQPDWKRAVVTIHRLLSARLTGSADASRVVDSRAGGNPST